MYGIYDKHIGWNTETERRYPASEGGDFQETLNGEK